MRLTIGPTGIRVDQPNPNEGMTVRVLNFDPRRLKVSTSLLLAAALGVCLTGCGSGGSSSDNGNKSITVITSNDAPFSFKDTKTGKLKGIDGEMINAIAKKEGWDLKVLVTDFNTMIPALRAKKGDMIVDGMYITEERQKEINFSKPWYTEGEALIVPAGSTVKSRDDLKGKVIGAQTGTVFTDFIKTLGPSSTKFYDSQATLMSAVANKQVDGGITDSALVAYSLVQHPNPKIEIVDPYTPYFPGTIGAGLRKDDTKLLDQLNSGLATLQKSPEYLEILKKYGLGESNAAK